MTRMTYATVAEIMCQHFRVTTSVSSQENTRTACSDCGAELCGSRWLYLKEWHICRKPHGRVQAGDCIHYDWTGDRRFAMTEGEMAYEILRDHYSSSIPEWALLPPLSRKAWITMIDDLRTVAEFTSSGFDVAIQKIKQGKKMARRGWNGKGMYVFLASHIQFNAERARPYESAKPSPPALAIHAADGMDVVGWIASQADMLSGDWFEVTP
jgi:hypothetical protein